MTFVSDESLERLRSAASAPDLSGTRYRLVGELGRGGMSTVFLAEDEALERRVALKVLDVPDDSGDLAERLTREARVLARLEHPAIAPVHDVGRLPDGRVFYAMKLIDGPRLDTFLREPRTLRERLRLFGRIAEAVAFAHDRGVIHRDIKPENVMVGAFGEVLVMDWGLATTLGAPPDAPHGTVIGTPGYMAPEQARGDVARVDARSDVFSLGAVLLHLIGNASHEPSARDVPKPLAAIAAKAMAEDPADRYRSALELGEDVARYLDGERVLADREGPWRRASRLYARHRVAFWLVMAYLVTRGTLLLTTGR